MINCIVPLHYQKSNEVGLNYPGRYLTECDKGRNEEACTTLSDIGYAFRTSLFIICNLYLANRR